MQHKTSRYFDLSIPAPVRLELMRMAAEHHGQDYPNCPEGVKPKSWRDVRGTTHQNLRAYIADLDQGFNDEGGEKTPVWYCHTGPQFRGEKFVHECEEFRGNHTGWYTNHDGTVYKDGSGLARGIVGLLNHGRFIAGYWWGDNGERVYFPEVYEDLSDALNAADEHARVFAESAQEDSAKQYAIFELEEKRTEAETEIAETKARLREALALRHNPSFPYMTERIGELIEDIREAMAGIAKTDKELEDLED